MTRSLHPPITAAVTSRLRDLARGFSGGPLQSLSTEFNRGASEAVQWCAALEGNVNDRSLIVELELSKKYRVVEGSPCDGGHSCPIEGEPNID
jgi:hypothetical protein